MAEQAAPALVAPAWSPWRAVIGFGVVSLAADMVYEGARSVTGPLLASLGASALLVGLVTGVGEALALILRLPSGTRVDHSGNYWGMAIGGYALTAVCVPLLAVTPFLGAAGLTVGCLLVLAERTGKAVRSPSKSTLLAHAAGSVGRGRGFAVHKALDQVGAFAGPLVVAGSAAVTGVLWPGFVLLAIPGAVAMLLLAQLRRRAPVEGRPARARSVRVRPRELPTAFRLFALSAAASTAGLMTFGVISYAAVAHEVVTTAAVPVVYAGAMAVEALGALATGATYDRVGARVLYPLPLLVAAVPALVFAGRLGPVLVGIALWALATGIQDSTVKALVADLVPRTVLGTAYGLFAAAQGLGALGGGALAGALYADHLGLLVAVLAALQLVSLVTLVPAVRRSLPTAPPAARG